MYKIIILFFIPILALAELKINSKIKHYEIYPSSKKDLKRALFSKTPIIISGRKYIGLTEWTIDIDYKSMTKNSTCKLVKLDTFLNIVIILPTISKKEKVSYNTKNTFKRFYKKLHKHEKKHKNYAVKAAKEVNKKLLSLGAKNNCKELRRVVSFESKKIIEKYKKINKKYDEKTDHGHLEGADIDSYL